MHSELVPASCCVSVARVNRRIFTVSLLSSFGVTIVSCYDSANKRHVSATTFLLKLIIACFSVGDRVGSSEPLFCKSLRRNQLSVFVSTIRFPNVSPRCERSCVIYNNTNVQSDLLSAGSIADS